MSALGNPKITWTLRLALDDAGGWRRNLLLLVFFICGAVMLATLLLPYGGGSSQVQARAALIALAVLLPLIIGYRTGARISALMHRPALAALPGIRGHAAVSTAALALVLLAVAAFTGAALPLPVDRIGLLPAGTSLPNLVLWGALSVLSFGSGLLAGRRLFDGHRADGNSGRSLPPTSKPNAAEGAFAAPAVSPSGAVRLRQATAYIYAAENRWSLRRLLTILTILSVGPIVMVTIVNVLAADGTGLAARLQQLLFAPPAGGIRPDGALSASRDLLAPLAFVPLFALAQHRGLGYLPFSRNTIAGDAARHFYRLAGAMFTAVCTFSCGVVAAVAWSAHAQASERVIPFLVAALLVAAALPLLTCLTLRGASSRWVQRRRPPHGLSLRQIAFGGSIVALGYVVIQLCVYAALALRDGALDASPIAVGVLVALAATAAALPAAFRRYYATVPLAP